MIRTLCITVLAFVFLGLSFDSYAVSCDKKAESDQRKSREIQMQVQSGHIPSKEDEDFVVCMMNEEVGKAHFRARVRQLKDQQSRAPAAAPPPRPSPPKVLPPPQPQPRVQADARVRAEALTRAETARAETARVETARAETQPADRTRAKSPPQPQRAAQKRCPAADLAPFPWPNPPRPSVTALVPRYLLFADNGTTKSLMAVGARLEGAISRADYRQPKYLGAGCEGFAIVLDLERIDADGRRKGGTEGFAPPSQEADFNLAQYVRRLFYAPPGHYRQIVFVVSEERLTNATSPPTEAQLREIARDGASSLPPDFANVIYTPKHVVLALIYEFEKGPRDGDLKVFPPDGRLGATVHLMKARLF